MSGYSPLYPSMFEGSLRGKPTQLLVWTWVIAHKDMFGVIDQHPRCCADATGLSLDMVIKTLAEFCAPDPESRSQEHDGRRLIALDGRAFGWRVVTHELYRDRARKKAWNDEATASGRDAERKRAERAAQRGSPSGGVQPRPDASGQTLPSETESSTETESESESDSEIDSPPGPSTSVAPRSARRATRGWKRLPADWSPSAELRQWAAAKAPDVDLDRELEAIRDYEFQKLHTDADATVRTWLRTEQKRLQVRNRMNGGRQPLETKFAAAKRRLREAAE